jgi:hypothetical protein
VQGNADAKARKPYLKRRYQGDRIGRIFAYWAIFFFGQIFETFGSINYWATFFLGERM